jgi:hypothetical protein
MNRIGRRTIAGPLAVPTRDFWADFYFGARLCVPSETLAGFGGCDRSNGGIPNPTACDGISRKVSSLSLPTTCPNATVGNAILA